MRTPEPERQGVEGTVMDEDICQGVMAGKAAEENLLMVGGVDDDDDVLKFYHVHHEKPH